MIRTTQNDIRGWLARAAEKGATHMIVACDTFDWEDYPVFVLPGEDARTVAKQHDGPNMSKLMEVYHMGMDLEAQVSAGRSFNYDLPSPPSDKGE